MVAFLVALVPYILTIAIPAAGAAIIVFLKEILKALEDLFPGNN